MMITKASIYGGHLVWDHTMYQLCYNDKTKLPISLSSHFSLCGVRARNYHSISEHRDVKERETSKFRLDKISRFIHPSHNATLRFNTVRHPFRLFVKSLCVYHCRSQTRRLFQRRERACLAASNVYFAKCKMSNILTRVIERFFI